MSSEKKYLNDLKNAFVSMGKVDKHYIKELEKQVKSLPKTKEVSYNYYVECFGYPEDIALAYFNNIDNTSNFFIKLKIKKFLFIIAIIITLLTSIFLISEYIDGKMQKIDNLEIIIKEE